MQETTTIKLQGVVFSNAFFNKDKIETLAHRKNIILDLDSKSMQITGTWHAIVEFRKRLHEEIFNVCKSFSAPVEINENGSSQGVVSPAKGRIDVPFLSADVLSLMQKCGVYQNSCLKYDTEGGCVIINCPGDDEAASTIAEEFQTQYRELMMSKKLKECNFPIQSTNSDHQIDKLVSQFNSDFNQSFFKYNKETKVIKCVSMSARQLNHIKAKVTELLQPLPAPAVNHTSSFIGDESTSMSITFAGGKKLTLKQANIVEEAVDAIVNASNENLQHIGGVALAINKASKGMVQSLSNAIIHQRKNIPTGTAVHTGAGGALKCKYVIHTVGPEQSIHGHQTEHLLWSACNSTLQLAEKLGVTSLAIPPISSGLFGVPKDIVAKTIIQTVCNYHVHTEGILQDVRIVIIDKETYLAFMPTFTSQKVILDSNKVVPQLQSSILPHTLQQSYSFSGKSKEIHRKLLHLCTYACMYVCNIFTPHIKGSNCGT